MSPARKEPDTGTYSGRFAVRLRKLREKAGLTPQEVADALGVDLSAVYHWESGRSAPTIANLPNIAEVLKLKKTRDLFPNE